MQGYVVDICDPAIENDNFRRVLYTAKNMQLALMCLKPEEDIGEEVHDLDQFIKCESGIGQAILNGVQCNICVGFAVLIPAGTKHNIINSSVDQPLKLYTLYTPPNHRDKVIHKTKQEAEADEESFDGIITEE